MGPSTSAVAAGGSVGVREAAAGAGSLHRHPERSRVWGVAMIAVVYAAIVVHASVHHEPWRDEVVPLSMARDSPSVGALRRTLGYEAKPILWPLCLRYASAAVGSTVALKVVSVVVAIAAVLLFLGRAPFPLWLKTLFVFGFIPLYEYAVVCRDYGLGMLGVFAFCALYPERRRRPVAVALVLALLANSCPPGLVLAVAVGLMLLVDALRARERPRQGPEGRFGAAVVLYVAGIVAAVITATPPDDGTMPVDLYHRDPWVLGSVLLRAVAFPAGHTDLLPAVPWPSALLWLYFLTLLSQPGLLCFVVTTLASFETLFALAVPPNFPRVGFTMVTIVATEWLARTRAREVGSRPGAVVRWVRVVLGTALAVTLYMQAKVGVAFILNDVRTDYSSSRNLAALIARDSRLHDAVVIGEPEPLVLSLPYYASNRIYLPQERVFRDWLEVRRGRRADMSLGELLEVASELWDRDGHPVVLALGWTLDGEAEQKRFTGSFFEQTFTITAAARAAFVQRAEHLATLRDAVGSDENYDVYVLW